MPSALSLTNGIEAFNDDRKAEFEMVHYKCNEKIKYLEALKHLMAFHP